MYNEKDKSGNEGQQFVIDGETSRIIS